VSGAMHAWGATCEQHTALAKWRWALDALSSTLQCLFHKVTGDMQDNPPVIPLPHVGSVLVLCPFHHKLANLP
jgi:hypothetical protein